MRTTIARIIIALSLAVMASACSAAPIQTTVPTNINEITTSEPGASLAQYGYTPVTIWYIDDMPVGYIYVNCGDDSNISACGQDLHNRGTKPRPNIYVGNDGKLSLLEGPHARLLDDRNYYATVPEAYQVFHELTPEQQQQLFGVMQHIADALGSPSDDTQQTVLLDIGQVQAWVAR